MANRLDIAENDNASPVAGALLHYIQQQWLRLLARESLPVRLQLTTFPSGLRCEIFIGDEFLRADKRYVDVVIKSVDERAQQLLPTVLVFEKPVFEKTIFDKQVSEKHVFEKRALEETMRGEQPRLVQHELNGLQLDTPVMASVSSESDDIDFAEMTCLTNGGTARGNCYRVPRANLMAIY